MIQDKSMRIAVAPNAFRGSLTALEAVQAISDGLRNSLLRDLEIIPMPLADGGDGTLDVLLAKLPSERITMTVTGPNGAPLNAVYGIIKEPDGTYTAIIEIARASG